MNSAQADGFAVHPTTPGRRLRGLWQGPLAAFLWVLCAGPALGLEGTERFTANYDLIYQIRDVASAASSKSAIGSGFRVSGDGLLITNYHVVSNYVRAPSGRNLEFLDQAGASGPLELLDFDVINDLALLRRSTAADEKHFPVASEAPGTGEIIYAVGNPHDLGMTLIFGNSNGLVEHSFNEQILFSGSLNPGMSGGPGLNEAGAVIGVNVATAGSQLSFLVPASKVSALLARNRNLEPDDFDGEIAAQIKQWQQQRISDLLERDWSTQAIGDFQVPGEIRQDIQCWGSSNDDDTDAAMRKLRMSCNSGNQIYLGRGLNTGQIHYSFDRIASLQLPSYRFHKLIGNERLSADNAASDKDVTPYRCQSEFLSSSVEPVPSGTFRKASYCVRAYKKLPGLFDVLFIGEQNAALDAFSAHFTLAGVERDLADAFFGRFLATLGWN